MRFSDVVISPFSELLDKQFGGSAHRGGPAWPDWTNQTSARHCHRGAPIDVEPEPVEPVATIDVPIAWGGPITRHFGHQLVDFSMRLLPTVDALPGITIAFAAHPREGIESFDSAPSFFAEILNWLAVPEADRLFIGQPTLVRDLSILPQAEQPYGPGPSAAHLDRLDRLTSSRLGSVHRLPCVYVSRAGQQARFAGEAYLEEVFRRAGATVVRPELLPLADQLRAYAAAELLIFAEGSAIHSVNLIGRALGDVVVINRRPGKERAIESIAPRARSVTYVDVVASVVHGLRSTGEPAVEAGLTTLDYASLLLAIVQRVPGLANHFDPHDFADAQERDALLWLSEKRTLGIARQPGSRDFLLRTLRDSGLGHLARSAEEIFANAARPFASRQA